jgi:lipoprotein signal peptidase
VPLSGIILIMLIVLCIISPFPVIATPLALLTSWLSRVMNLQIARLNNISFSVVNNIEAGLMDTVLFYACIVLLTCWLTSKRPFAALALLFVILVWLMVRRSVCG